jgi:hypothetical protein
MITCSCGFTETADEILADHLGEMFIPDDDTDEASHVHAETHARTCLCGHVAASAADLDAHLLAAFTSPGHLGRDGRAHNPAEEDPGCATVRT